MQDNRNTAFGWILFAGIIALGSSYLSSKVFHADSPESPEQPGYFIDAPEEGAGAESGPTIAQALAAGSAEAGEKVFAKCTACHTINQGGAAGIGPNLYGIMGKPIGKHAAGFAYSSALSEKGGVWDFDAMNEWLKSPRGFAAGTKMSFAGLGSIEDRANVILYMLANGGGPPLPEPEAEEAAVEGEIDGAGEGPGPAEGAEASAVEAAGAMGDEQPVVDQSPVTEADGSQ
ncbi:cytochrome c family protein [Erythrobacteraceae bacterium WH01K]|nr:cytochrome c family protein [Erythrobacteraceae bacterium WH01K]